MNKLKMRFCGDLVLREKCEPVLDISNDVLSDMNQMIKMMKSENGVGLAAPQVGILKRFIVMMDPDTGDIYKMINPKILSKSENQVTLEEGCLSVLGNNDLPVYANVTRPESVVIEWQDENGNIKKAKMSGVPARIAQHETDHLDGILFIDYLSPLRREMLMRKVKKNKK